MSAKPQASIKERISAYLQASEDKAFLRREFGRFGAYQQVGKALRDLVGDGTLVRIGHGLYAKARRSSVSGRPVPVDTLQNLALNIMKKLGIQADLGRDARALREGRSTQVPMAIVINVGEASVRRKITFGSRVVLYEKD